MKCEIRLQENTPVGWAAAHAPIPPSAEDVNYAYRHEKHIQHRNLMLFGCWFESGWTYDFRKGGMKKYVYKLQKSKQLREAWAPNKGVLKAAIFWPVSYMLEIPEEGR